MTTIAPATVSDAKVVAALIRRSFARQAQILGIRESEYPNYVAFETQARVETRMASGIVILIARIGAGLVGTVSCAVRAERRGEIIRLAVDPAHRGRGYGRKLMECAEQEIAAAGASVAELSIVRKFERLRLYYEALGYCSIGTRNVPSLPFEVLYMGKPLDGTSALSLLPPV
jgi:ribosomal protein S18 acetylase RimI-like enzyme